jgi:hypothetical protein
LGFVVRFAKVEDAEARKEEVDGGVCVFQVLEGGVGDIGFLKKRIEVCEGRLAERGDSGDGVGEGRVGEEESGEVIAGVYWWAWRRVDTGVVNALNILMD